MSITGLLLTGLLIWPIIVNSQPGTQFFYFFIDWKADNLDNTLFWSGIVLIILYLILAGIADKYKKEKETIIKDTRYRDDIPK